MNEADIYCEEAQENADEVRQMIEEDGLKLNDCPPFGEPPAMTDEQISAMAEEAWGKEVRASASHGGTK